MAEYRAMGGVRKGREKRDGDMEKEGEEKGCSGCNKRGRRGKKEIRDKRTKGGGEEEKRRKKGRRTDREARNRKDWAIDRERLVK